MSYIKKLFYLWRANWYESEGDQLSCLFQLWGEAKKYYDKAEEYRRIANALY